MAKPLPLTKKLLTEQIEKNLKQIVKETNKYETLVGIPGEAKPKSGKSKDYISTYAAKNEFGVYGGAGVPSVPARPFMRDTMKTRLKNIQKAALKFFIELANNPKSGSVKETLEKLGLYTAGQIQDNITKGKWTPNSPVTIKKKGSSKPLIDSGDMRGAVTAWVKKKENT